MAAEHYKVKYREHVIVLKQDFGQSPGFHLIDGMPCAWGYVVTNGGIINVMPGATWFQTVQDAKEAIDVLLATRSAEEFWALLQRIREVKRQLVQEIMAGPTTLAGDAKDTRWWARLAK